MCVCLSGAALFVGEHDFSAFANSCEAKERGAVRTITRFQLVEVDEEDDDEGEEDREGVGWTVTDRLSDAEVSVKRVSEASFRALLVRCGCVMRSCST